MRLRAARPARRRPRCNSRRAGQIQPLRAGTLDQLGSQLLIRRAVFAARAQRRASRAANTRLGGVGGLGVAGASFCCCCTPALYPVLALALGTTTAFSVSAWLLGTTSPFYNLSMIVMIGLMLGMLLAVSRRIHRLQHMDVITATPATGTGAGPHPEAVR